ncbi:coiled-coil domain-containing protein 86-like [Aplysia californica]|uniref:Coiled-coil domain-containing protein 86-like n=1 Tax=Aplysia californica TaxID=6500 RepID=A0ABM1VWC6_APLCA|nr:coiled-coil domain-containing protein 86-like [Aplysia californica]
MILGEQRAKVSEDKIRAWFREVELALAQDGINIATVSPHCIFNVDESGFPFFQGGSVVVTDAKEKHPYSIGSDTKTQITVLCAGSAGGRILSPFMIFPGIRWTYHPWDDFKEAHYDLTPNGWVNSQVFLTWLKNVFEPATKHLPRPVVLFADGHQSHVNMDVHFFCKQHQITYYVLPAHASHIVQPLDLIFYGVLKRYWGDSVKDYKRISNVGAVTKKSFAMVFREAWLKAHTPEKMAHAFEAAGLSPWNPDRPDYSKCRASRVYGNYPAVSSPSPNPLSSVPGPSVEPSPSVCPAEDLSPVPGPCVEPSPSVCPAGDLSPVPGPCVEPSPSVCPAGDLSPVPGPCVEQSPSVCPAGDLSPVPGPCVEPSPSVCPAGDLSPVRGPCVEQSPSVCPAGDLSPVPGPCVEQSPSVCPAGDLSSVLGYSTDLSSPAAAPRTKSIAMAVDQLVDFIISSGWSAADMYSVRRQQWRNVPPGPGDDKYRQYLELYNDIVPPPTFDNLPLPQKSSSAKSATRVQPPKYVSGEKFRDFQERREREERDKKEAIEERKRERARKKAEKDAEKEKKRLERETAKRMNAAEKEAEKERKKIQRKGKRKATLEKKHKGKSIKKRRADVLNEAESESESDSVGVQYMDSSGDECEEVFERMLHEYDENTCFDCGSDRDLDGWIACDRCDKWYHRRCTGSRMELIVSMSEDEVSEYRFICDSCIP